MRCFVTATPEQAKIARPSVAVAEILTRLSGQPEALEVAVGDDIHNTTDRVGAINGGRAILQDLDTLDYIVGDRVEVDCTWHTGRRCARNPALAVNKHERAFRFEVT